LKAISKIVKNSVVCSLVRSIDTDIIAAAEALEHANHPRIHIFTPTSKILIESQLNKNSQEILEIIEHSIRLGKTYCLDIEWSAMDSTRTSDDFLRKCIEAAIQGGANTINIADTLGCATPWDFQKQL
jgi:2-isopropylmalate synthase